MTHIVQFRYPARDGELFAPGAFSGNIGKVITVTIAPGLSRTGKVTKAVVVDDGEAVLITLDVPDD